MDGAASPGVMNARQTEKRRHFGMRDKAVCHLDKNLIADQAIGRCIARAPEDSPELFSEWSRSNLIIQTWSRPFLSDIAN
jgi:hypothetical protein